MLEGADREYLIKVYTRKFEGLLEDPELEKIKRKVANLYQIDRKIDRDSNIWSVFTRGFPFDGGFGEKEDYWKSPSSAGKISSGIICSFIRETDPEYMRSHIYNAGPKDLRTGIEDFYDSVKPGNDPESELERRFEEAKVWIGSMMIPRMQKRLAELSESVHKNLEDYENEQSTIRAESGEYLDQIKSSIKKIYNLVSSHPGMIKACFELSRHDPSERLADVPGSEKIRNIAPVKNSNTSPDEYFKDMNFVVNYRLQNAVQNRAVNRVAAGLANAYEAAIEPLQQILFMLQNEGEVPESYAEAPAGAPLGRVAFAMARHGKPLEVDTEVEEKLLDAIRGHILYNHKMRAEDFNLMQDLESQGLYRKVFRKPDPKHETLYRGISVFKDWITDSFDVEKLLSMRNEQLTGEGSKPISLNYFKGDMSGTYTINFKVKPDEDVSSWTASEKLAKSFTRHSLDTPSGRTHYKVVLYARPSDNPGRFLNLDGTYLITDLAPYAAQKEYAALGQINCFAISLARIKSSDRDLDKPPGEDLKRSSPEKRMSTK
jgi:hypothetical protein